MQAIPVVEGEIDDHQSRGRQLLAQPLARLDVAGGDQHQGELVHSGIMGDHH